VRGEDLYDIGHARDGDTGRIVNELANVKARPTEKAMLAHIIAIRVDGFSIEPFLALLLVFFDMFAHPYVTVQSENKIDATR
jgi:hypothetical protein